MPDIHGAHIESARFNRSGTSVTRQRSNVCRRNGNNGNCEKTLTALIEHIRRLDRKQRNAVARGDYQQACKHEQLIDRARIRLVYLTTKDNA